jgi:tetratricopeptide (TPR) repeat protein/O-antigen ligase
MNIRNILKWLIYACALIPLIIFSQYVSPFHFGKIVVFRSLIEIMAVFYLVLVLKDRSYLPRRDGFFWAFLGLTLAFTITTLTSVDRYVSFWGTLERMGGLWSFWHYFIFYIILTSILKTRTDWLNFLRLTILVGVLSAFYGFGQRTNFSFFIGSGGRARIFGTIGNPALFAGYEIINIFLALILYLDSKIKRERWLMLASALIMSLAVLMTAVRGSILGLSIGIIVFTFLYFSQTHSKLAKKAFYGLVTLAVIFIGFSFAFKNTSFVQNSAYLKRVTDFSPSNFTVQTRFWAWQAGLKGWSSSPRYMLVGWGPENFNIPFSKNFNPKFFTGPGAETLFDRAHNMFIEILVTMGILGFVAYIALFVIILRSLWKLMHKSEYRTIGAGLIALTVAYAIHNAFIFDTSANFIVFFSVLGFMSFLTRGQQETKTSQVVSPALRGIIGAVLFIVIGILIYRTNILQSKANYANTRGIIAGWNNDFNGAVDKYKESVSYGVPGTFDFRNRLAQYLLDYSNDNTVNNDAKEIFKYAISEEQKNAVEHPADYLPDLYLSRLNIILGKDDPKSPYNDEALKYSTQALTLSPTFVRTYFEVGQAYLNKKDYPKAEEAFQKAIDLNPEAGISYWYLGVVKIQNGKVQEGFKLTDIAMTKGYTLSENDYLNLASSYIKRNDYPHLVVMYEGLTKLVPNNANYHASLAVAYSKVGRIDDAVKEAHAAAQADPGFTNDAKAFVQQLGRQW